MNQRTGKKLIALFTAVLSAVMVFSFGGAGVSAAANTPTDKQLIDLKAFGIFQGDENGDMQFDKEITRAEFAKAVVKEMKLDDAAETLKQGTTFRDLPPSHYAYGAVSVLAGIGLISGEPDGNFYPDEAITFPQAAKILVNMLGYGGDAVRRGGYPNGYVAQAGLLGITKGVTLSDDQPLDRGTVMVMMYNCLDIDRVVSVTNDWYGAQVSDSTLRELLEGDNRDGVIKMRGIVTATYESYLNVALPNIKEWEVEIDNVRYNKGETNAEVYLGQEVDFYVQVSDSEDDVIKEIMPTNRNETLAVSFDNINSFSKTAIEYEDPESGEYDLKETIDPNAVYLYNGRKVKSFEELNAGQIKDGSVRMIANSSGDYNVIFVNEYQSFVVDKISEADKRIFFAGTKRFNNKKSILLEDQDNIISSITDETGKAIAITEIDQDEVVSIFASKDETLLKVVRSAKTAEGTVTQRDDVNNTLTIDGTDYYYENGLDVTKMLGENVMARLNFEGKIADIEKFQSTKKYGAIVAVNDSQGGVNGTVQVRMLLPGTIADDSEEQESDDPNDTEIPAIAARNKAAMTLDFASKARIDNVSYSGDDITKRLAYLMRDHGFIAVSYNLNEAGELTKINSLETEAGHTSRKYNAYEKTFAANGQGGFGLSDSTMAICIPWNTSSNQIVTDASREDYLVKIKMNNSQNYYVSAYEKDDNTKCPELVVFCQEMNSVSSGSTTSSSKVAMVSKMSTTVNSDGDEVQTLTLMTEDGEVIYDVSESTSSNSDFTALRTGDLIFYSLDNLDRLDGYDLIDHMNPLPFVRHDTTDISREIFSGYLVDTDYDIVSDSLNKWSDRIYMLTETGEADQYDIPHKNAPPIFVYDTGRKTVELGEPADFQRNQKQAYVVASMSGVRKVKAVVVIL